MPMPMRLTRRQNEEQEQRDHTDDDAVTVRGFDADLVVTHYGTMMIEQEGGFTAFVKGSLGFRRDPRLSGFTELLERLTEQRPAITPPPPGMKWCSGGHWVEVAGFSPDPRNRDGLHSHCKACRAEHARRMRAAQAAHKASK